MLIFLKVGVEILPRRSLTKYRDSFNDKVLSAKRKISKNTFLKS